MDGRDGGALVLRATSGAAYDARSGGAPFALDAGALRTRFSGTAFATKV